MFIIVKSVPLMQVPKMCYNVLQVVLGSRMDKNPAIAKCAPPARTKTITIYIAGSSNGRTVAFEAIYLGSNPGPAASLR